MAKKRGAKRTSPELQDLERKMAENRAAFRQMEEMYRAGLRELEEARIARLAPKHRPKKRYSG